MSAVAVSQCFPFSHRAAKPEPTTSFLSLREAVCQTHNSSRNLLGLMALSNAAQRDLESELPEVSLDGVISKAVLRSLLGALNYRDAATLRHSRRVALLAVGLAHHLGWEGRDLRILEVAALLHDVGKIGVPDTVLYKPGKLRAEETEIMSLHYRVGLCVLQACRVDPKVLRIVDESHRASDPEEFDRRINRGINMGARILTVADAYESLFTDQVYRSAKSHEEIMRLLMVESGKHFDGDVVAALARWVQQDGLPFAAQNAELNEVGHNRAAIGVEEAAEAMALCQIFSYLYVLESAYDGFHMLDSDRKFVIWSRGAERLVGNAADEMLGEKWKVELFGIPVEGQERSEEDQRVSTIDNAINCGKSTITQGPFRRCDDSTIQLELQTVPLIDAKGKLHGVAEIFRNLSRKHQEPEFKELKLQASRDALTSVANRGELEKKLQLLMDEYLTNPAEPFSVIFADADHFKRVNDTYGHQAGDQVLIDLAKHFTDETYSGEIVGRYGGEEFVILCPGTDLENAVRRAERLRSSMTTMKVGGIDKLRISCSFGVAQVESTDTGETLVSRADRALYMAKEAGRDRTCSLSREQLLASSSEANKSDPKTAFEYSSSFQALIGAEMVIHKLRGFIGEHKADVIEATRECVKMTLSGDGIMGYFGSSPSRQGIHVELLMQGASQTANAQRLRINVNMRPHGWYRNSRAFDERSQLLMRELRRYFFAE